jgi:heptosyltransferase-2
MLSSSIEALKNNQPTADIDIIIPNHSKFAYENNKHIRNIYTFDNSGKWTLFISVLKRLFNLRKIKYDYVLNFHADHLSALISRLLCSKKRAVYNQGHTKPNLFSEYKVPGKGEVKSVIEKDYDLLRAVGETVKKLYPTKIYLKNDDVESFRAYLSDLGVKGDRKIIAIHMGASKPTKKWRNDYLAELVMNLVENYDVIFIHSPSEENDAIALKSLLPLNPPNVYYVATKTLSQLSLIIKHSDLFLAMDSGPKHIGVAVDTPTLTIFSSESMGEYHPYTARHHKAVRAEVDCRPNYKDKKGFEWCGLSSCDSMLCMKKITPSFIYEEIQNMLKTEGKSV